MVDLGPIKDLDDAGRSRVARKIVTTELLGALFRAVPGGRDTFEATKTSIIDTCAARGIDNAMLDALGEELARVERALLR